MAMDTILSAQSAYSLLWGTALPEELFARAAHLGYRRLAIADHGALYALPRIRDLAKQYNITPIYGASLPLPGERYLTILIETQDGYRRLCRILTDWHQGIPFAAEEHSGLLFLTDAVDLATGLHEKGAAVWYRIGASLQVPDLPGIPKAVAPEVCMLQPEDHVLHRLLRVIHRNSSPKLRPDPWHSRIAPATACLEPPETFRHRFALFEDALQQTEALAERACFAPAPRTVFPPCPSDKPATQELRALAFAGAANRYPGVNAPVRKRMEYELNLIQQKGFCEYFLVVHDIVRQSPRTCGRGSGAASLVNYCLGVTNVDPIRHNLMFERFLNPGREDPPDIDIDFAWDERDDILEYVFATYGTTHAAMVCNHLTFQPRMAVRETARAFGLTEDEISRGMSKLPEMRDEYTPEPIATRKAAPDGNAPQVLHMPPPWHRIVPLAQGLLGRPRALSLHCGGVVITPDRLTNHVPVETSAKGHPMIQWEKDGTEEMGLVKIDLLGNRSLAVIRDATESLLATGAPPPDRHPEDDPAVKTLFAEGRSMGVFYVESPAMRLLQQKAGRGDFESLVIHSSIIRPAANDYINEYLERLHGKPWQPFHPHLAGILDESYGIPVYQEDVCRILIALAGYSHSEADRFRKCLGKRDARARLEAQKQEFLTRCREREVDKATIDRIWHTFLSMTGYSFCKPHSASYAQVSFESAWLRQHHPAHFMAAVLSNGGGYYSTQAYISEAMRMNIPILGPDINRSRICFCEEHGAIRVGLMAIQGLHNKIQKALVEERSRNGPYRNLGNLLQRTTTPFSDLQRLSRIGAFDSIAPGCNRPQILWMLGRLTAQERSSHSLFADADALPTPPHLPCYTPRQRQEHEYANLGFLLADHPLTLFDNAIAGVRSELVSSCQLASRIGRRVKLMAWPVTAKVVSTRQREPMIFVSFEDFDGIYETVLFPKAYARYARIVTKARPYKVTGQVCQDWKAINVIVDQVEPIT